MKKRIILFLLTTLFVLHTPSRVSAQPVCGGGIAVCGPITEPWKCVATGETGVGCTNEWYCCQPTPAPPPDSEPLPPGTIGNPLGGILVSGEPFEIISNLVQLLINVAFVVGVLIFIFMIISGALQWMTSGGDQGKMASAKGRITSALFGLLLLFSLFFLLDFFEEVFGVSIVSLDLGDIAI